MKIKRVIEDLKKLKNDSKNISRTFSGFVEYCGVSTFLASSLV